MNLDNIELCQSMVKLSDQTDSKMTTSPFLTLLRYSTVAYFTFILLKKVFNRNKFPYGMHPKIFSDHVEFNINGHIKRVPLIKIPRGVEVVDVYGYTKNSTEKLHFEIIKNKSYIVGLPRHPNDLGYMGCLVNMVKDNIVKTVDFNQNDVISLEGISFEPIKIEDEDEVESVFEEDFVVY